MRVIYFTYVQSTQYLRFYFKPSTEIDGVIVISDHSSFVYFKTPQNNVQESLRIIDKDIELMDCRFSYSVEDLYLYLQDSNIIKPCKTTTRLLADLYAAQLFTKNNSQKYKKVSKNIARFASLRKGISEVINHSPDFLN